MTIEFFLTRMAAEKSKEDYEKILPLASEILEVEIVDPILAYNVGTRVIASYKPYVTLPTVGKRRGFIVYSTREGYDWLPSAGMRVVKP